MVSAGSYLLERRPAGGARPLARLQRLPPARQPAAGLVRRPRPPGRVDPRHRPPDLARRAAGHREPLYAWSLVASSLVLGRGGRLALDPRCPILSWVAAGEGGRGRPRPQRPPPPATGPAGRSSRAWVVCPVGDRRRRRPGHRPLGPHHRQRPRTAASSTSTRSGTTCRSPPTSPRATRCSASTTTRPSSPTGSTRRTPSFCTRWGSCSIHRDTLSLFLNLGWLAIAFLAAWCVGRPYGRGHLSVVAVAILLECHTLVVREPGAAKNDLATAALLLAAIAILVTAWACPPRGRGGIPRAAAGHWRRPASPSAWPRGRSSRSSRWPAALSVAVLALAPVRAPPARGRLVVSAGAGRRRLLVPAQPDRGRQPPAGGRPPRADHPAPPGAAAESPGRTSASPTTRPNRHLAPLLRAGAARPVRGALAAGRRRRAAGRDPGPRPRAATGSCAGSARSPCSG